MKVLIVVEETPTGYSAYSPDLLGCVATGEMREVAEKAMNEAVEFHVSGLREEGAEIPTPHCYSKYLDVPA